MTTKVEQLVMGAFWEAADQLYRRDGFGRLSKDDLDDLLALRLAYVIRRYGIEGDCEFWREKRSGSP